MAERSDFSTVMTGMNRIRDRAKAQSLPVDRVRNVARRFLESHGWEPEEFKAARSGEVSNSWAGPALQGATFGYADELMGVGAGLRGLISGEGFGPAYDKSVERSRNSLEAYRADNPTLSTALELGGAIVPSIAATIATGGAAAPVVGGALRTGTSLAGRGAVSGAASGALYGSGQGEGLQDRAQRAGVGAALGGAVGAVAPVAVQGLRAGARQIGMRLPGGDKRAADYVIRRSMERDNIGPAALAGNLDEAAKLGKPATPADVGGANLKGLAEAVASAPGEGMDITRGVLERRAQAMFPRMVKDVSKAFGNPHNAMNALEHSRAMQERLSTPIYDAVRATPLDDAVWKIFQRESQIGHGAAATSLAKRSLQSRYGTPSAKNMPRMAVVDEWKRAMDEAIGTALKHGNRDTASAAMAQRDRVLNAVDAAVPDYVTARATYGGPAQFQLAVEEGTKIMQPAYGVDQLGAWLKTASPSQVEAFRIGAASRLAAALGNDSAKMPNLTKLVRAPNMRAKIEMVIGDPARIAEWRKALDLEEAMSDTAQKALTNSRTAPRLAMAEDLNDMGAGPETIAAMLGNSQTAWGAVAGLSKRFGKRIADTWNAKRNAEIARQMLETDPAAAAQNLARLSQRGPVKSASPGWGGVLGAQSGGGLAGALPGPRQPQEAF